MNEIYKHKGNRKKLWELYKNIIGNSKHTVTIANKHSQIIETKNYELICKFF
jgi:hypothetical protein